MVSFTRTTAERRRALSSFPEFMSAMEWSLTGTESRPALVFDENLSDESGIVKQYQLQLGDYKGVARLMANATSLYAQLIIGADKNDPDARRFLDSFIVGKANANDELTATNVISISEGSTNDELPPEPWSRRFSPINGGVLNGRALSLAQPEYPKAARKKREAGQVKLRIVIDESGKVISAEVLDGPESLRQAALDAAYKSRFSPTKLMGQPVKVSGIIIYNFVAQ